MIEENYKNDLSFRLPINAIHKQEKKEHRKRKLKLSPLKKKQEESNNNNNVTQKADAASTAVSSSQDSSFKRIVVYSRKDRSKSFQAADFSTCLFDYFGFKKRTKSLIECHLENDIVFLQPPPNGSLFSRKNERKRIYRFEHPAYCAVRRITPVARDKLPQEILERGIDVGVSIILESSDQELLMTRRAAHMRTFPGVWVPPGGHMESEESFEDAGLREVFEETGIAIKETTRYKSRILGLWESVFPGVLYEGQPKRHHIVVYLHVIVKMTSESLQNSSS